MSQDDGTIPFCGWENYNPDNYRLNEIPSLDNQKCYLVDGYDLKREVYIDWTDGGNHAKYPWIPKGERWIDIGLTEPDRDPTQLHEAIEEPWMERGMSYDDAHSLKANPAELQARQEDWTFEETQAFLKEYQQKYFSLNADTAGVQDGTESKSLSFMVMYLLMMSQAESH